MAKMELSTVTSMWLVIGVVVERTVICYILARQSESLPYYISNWVAWHILFLRRKAETALKLLQMCSLDEPSKAQNDNKTQYMLLLFFASLLSKDSCNTSLDAHLLHHNYYILLSSLSLVPFQMIQFSPFVLI